MKIPIIWMITAMITVLPGPSGKVLADVIGFELSDDQLLGVVKKSPKSTSKKQPTGKQPLKSGEKPSKFGKKPSISGKKPSLSDKKPSKFGKKPSLSGKRPSISDKKPSKFGKKPSTGKKPKGQKP